MVKGEIANRPKPTKEQVRVAQITQDGQTVNDPVQLNKIRKVIAFRNYIVFMCYDLGDGTHPMLRDRRGFRFA